MKTAQHYLAEANQQVPRLSVEEGIAKHGEDKVVFIDVRDGLAIQDSGTIAGALHIPRGFIEFAADEATDFHPPALQKDATLILVCGAGGMAALAGKTLLEMGYQDVHNVGGFASWKDAGGPTS